MRKRRNIAYPLRVRIYRQSLSTTETDQGYSRRISSSNSLIGRSGSGNYYGDACMCTFPDHTGGLSSYTAKDTMGEVYTFQDSVPDDFVNGIIPANIAAFDNTRTFKEKNGTMNPAGFSPEFCLNLPGD